MHTIHTNMKEKNKNNNEVLGIGRGARLLLFKENLEVSPRLVGIPFIFLQGFLLHDYTTLSSYALASL